MIRRIAPLALALFLLSSSLLAGSFSADSGRFLLDGRPFQIISGEIHYLRVPPEYWRDRLLMAKAMGLNTVTTYVFWNSHEPTQGTFNFSGGADLAAFVRTAQEVGLYVILRPGPYACAEWEFGGYPSWLLKSPPVTVRGGHALAGIDYAHAADAHRCFVLLMAQFGVRTVQPVSTAS